MEFGFVDQINTFRATDLLRDTQVESYSVGQRFLKNQQLELRVVVKYSPIYHVNQMLDPYVNLTPNVFPRLAGLVLIDLYSKYSAVASS